MTNFRNASQTATAATLIDQKQAILQVLVQEVHKANINIMSDVTLTNDQKNAQITVVEQLADITAATIDQCLDFVTAADELARGLIMLQSQHDSGESIVDQQALAQQKVVQLTAGLIDLINQDIRLDDDQKSSQILQLMRLLTQSQQTFADMKNAQEICENINRISEKLNNVYQPGPDIKQQQDIAQQHLVVEAEKVKAAITADIRLNDQQKANQTQLIDQQIQSASEIFTQMESAQHIKAVLLQMSHQIERQHRVELDLVNQKELAKGAVDTVKDRVKHSIMANQLLPDKTKEQWQKLADIEADKAKDIIEKTNDAQQLQNAKNVGFFKINHQYRKITDFQPKRESLWSNVASFTNDFLGQKN